MFLCAIKESTDHFASNLHCNFERLGSKLWRIQNEQEVSEMKNFEIVGIRHGKKVLVFSFFEIFKAINTS